MDHDSARWRRLCQGAYFELDQAKLPERISIAHAAVVERMLELKWQFSSQEYHELQSALAKLQRLRQEPGQVH